MRNKVTNYFAQSDYAAIHERELQPKVGDYITINHTRYRISEVIPGEGSMRDSVEIKLEEEK